MTENTIDIETLLWVADEIARDRERYAQTKLYSAAWLDGIEVAELLIRACASRVKSGGGLRPTSVMDKT